MPGFSPHCRWVEKQRRTALCSPPIRPTSLITASPNGTSLITKPVPPVARGTIVLEGSVVHPSDWPYEYAIFGYEAAVVDGYRQIANALHRHGALALAHLTHGGMQGSSHYSPIAAVGALASPGSQ